MDSQSVPDIASVAVPMTGSGYSLKAFADMPFSGGLGLIGRVGIEQFNLSGNSTTMGAVATSIMYATADALVRWNMTDGSFVPYLAGGLGVHFPLSKSSGILNVSQISSTTVFFLDLGADYSMSDSTYLTFHAEYGYFPPSNNITTNFIEFRGGIGFRM
jgi:outer membrane protein W